jgi:hypothetical protein
LVRWSTPDALRSLQQSEEHWSIRSSLTGQAAVLIQSPHGDTRQIELLGIV